MEKSGQLHAPTALPRVKRPRYPLNEDAWVRKVVCKFRVQNTSLARNLITLITQSRYTAAFSRNTVTHKNTTVCDNSYTLSFYTLRMRMHCNSYTLRAGHIFWRLVWILHLLVISISTAQWQPTITTANFNALVCVR